jgi:hypothetical protein
MSRHPPLDEATKRVSIYSPGCCDALHYLDDSLFDDPSFPVKKLHHKTFSHLFSEWMTLVGTKDNMHVAIGPQNKISYMMSREWIKFLTFTKYQKTHKELN